MKNNQQISRVLEIFWLTIAIFTFVIGVLTTFSNGISESYMFFIMCTLSTLLFMARRGLRKKEAKNK